MVIQAMSCINRIISDLQLSSEKRRVLEGSLNFVIFLCALKSIHNFSRIFYRGSQFQFNPSIYHLFQGPIQLAVCFVIHNWKPIVVEEVFNHIQIKRLQDELSRVSDPHEKLRIAKKIFDEGGSNSILKVALKELMQLFLIDNEKLGDLLSSIEDRIERNQKISDLKGGLKEKKSQLVAPKTHEKETPSKSLKKIEKEIRKIEEEIKREKGKEIVKLITKNEPISSYIELNLKETICEIYGQSVSVLELFKHREKAIGLRFKLSLDALFSVRNTLNIKKF